MSGESYWNGMDEIPNRKNIEARYPILRRDPGGFFAVIGLHTEAYPPETNIPDALMLDPVLAHWIPNEVAEEAGHLSFLFPSMKEYLQTGTLDEQDCRKRLLVHDNEDLLIVMLESNRKNAEGLSVGKLDLDPSVMEAFEHIPERTQYIFHTIGLEESYWPGYLVVSG